MCTNTNIVKNEESRRKYILQLLAYQHAHHPAKEAEGGVNVRPLFVMASIKEAKLRLLEDLDEGNVGHDTGGNSKGGGQNSAGGKLDEGGKEHDRRPHGSRGACAAYEGEGYADILIVDRHFKMVLFLGVRLRDELVL